MKNIIYVLNILVDHSKESDFNKDAKVIIVGKSGNVYESTYKEFVENNKDILQITEEELEEYDWSEELITICPRYKSRPYCCVQIETQEIESITI